MFTSKQIAALKYLIFNDSSKNEIAKRILAFLIKSSKKLTRGVCLSLVEKREGYTAEEIYSAAHAIDYMNRCNNPILNAMGSNLEFSIHYGDFDPNSTDRKLNTDGQFAALNLSPGQVSNPGSIRKGMPVRYTFWLAAKPYSEKAKLVVVGRGELDKIDLNKPGLYPNVENQK